MIGQLGSVSVAGVGMAGKFASIYSVVISAVGAVAGIMISQYLGQKNRAEIRRSFDLNLLLGLGVAGIFTLICLLIPDRIMGLYTQDPATEREAADYLAVVAATYIPMAGATMLSTLFRCMERPRLPLYASILSALLNTGLNYVLIFGKCGFAPMGARGAAIATAISQWMNLLLMCMMLSGKGFFSRKDEDRPRSARLNWKQYFAILIPILICELVWSLGENVYAAIYGHMGTEASAAMTLINPIQGLMIGALCGLSQAASILIGKGLGNGEYASAYDAARRLIRYGAIGASALSIAVILCSGVYGNLYQVEDGVKALTQQILIAYALVAPFKVLNMILGGGIIRSGGRTKYVMLIDLIGTWGFGVPLGLISAFVLKLTIPYVYFILSLEECIRFGISMIVFRKRKWMNRLEA